MHIVFIALICIGFNSQLSEECKAGKRPYYENKSYQSNFDTLISVSDTSINWSVLPGFKCIIVMNRKSVKIDTLFVDEQSGSDTSEQ
jgi:hypothetical protein